MINFDIKKKFGDFCLDISWGFDGGVLVMEGESGAGKTTVLNCIAGLEVPDQGSIQILEELFFCTNQKVNIPARRRNIGYVFQNYALFPHMSVYENIIYGIKNKPEYKDKGMRKEMLEYADYIMSALGIAHLKNKHSQVISGGEKQRTALSRAIVTKPKLLLLDEPFSALDIKTKEKIYEEFLFFKKTFQIPTILITHDPKESDLLGDEKFKIVGGQMMPESKCKQ